jgi:anti-sigma-K factor RskA
MMPCTGGPLGELVASYLLGSCTESEAADLEQHLESCPKCARAVEQLRPSRDALLVAVPPVSPSPALKARVMAAVDAEARLFAAARSPVERTPADRSTETPGGERRRRWLDRWRAPVPAWALGCCLIALLALGALVATGLDRGPAPGREIVARVDARQAPAGRATIRITSADATLNVQRFPAPGRGRVYQVWLVTGATAPRPTRAMFGVDAGRASVDLPPEAQDADELLVTSEPRGGSRSPTRPPVLSAPL